jgi:energy-coupling factor transporter ATP-binding protein EcfA2
MGTARQDFERFVRWLHAPDRGAPEDALRFANLVLADFDAVAATAHQRNKRSERLAEMARARLSDTSAAFPEIPEEPEPGAWPWVRLHRLTLGPFRGFRQPQDFDLSRRVVLWYGPNGSGKSSLCEALEYALRGSVEEAESKRLAEQDYLQNIHARRFDRPALTALDADGQQVDVVPDENAFRFFFVENNRIDNFARIAATPRAKRSALVATLFGMDQFNEFVSRFNDSMEAVLTLGNRFQILLAARHQALAEDERTIAGEANQLTAIDDTASAYAAGINKDLTFEELKALIGNPEHPGRLQELDARLAAIPPALTGLNRDRLAGLYRSADTGKQQLTEAKAELDARRSQVSFRALFTAVQALQAEDPGHCPACLTPINQVARNPFERAETGLGDLAALAGLEARHQQVGRELNDACRMLHAELQKLRTFVEVQEQRGSAVFEYLANLPEDETATDWWTGVYADEAQRGAVPSLEQLLEACDLASAQDAQTQSVIDARQADVDERRRLNDARVWAATYEAGRAAIVESVAQAKARVEKWQADNAELIRDAEVERQGNEQDRPIQVAYSRFYGLLNQFLEQLPGLLMADLNAETMALYNEFNESDRDEDKLADLRLPLTGDDAIEIAFRGDAGRRLNALKALSEGHIRCLGLAILLAKAKSINAPLIIFDDAINAIDHDHRSGIRAAIFESDRFRDTQLLVTCHSPEFIKDIENHLPAARRNDCKQYVLLHHNGNHQPRVRPDVGSLNYLVRARASLDRFDPRDALSFARKSLEMLTQKAWKWLESHGVGDISVLMDGPGREPQLRGLCEALRKRLTAAQFFVHPSKQPLLDSLNRVLGIPEQNLVWLLLNKGTHEEPDRDDFDLQHVRTVLDVLEAIDQLELRPNR